MSAPTVPRLAAPDPADEVRLREDLELTRHRGLRVGLVFLALLVVGAFVDLTGTLRSWLVAWFFVLGFALGSLALIHLNNATGGAWGVAIRRPCEAAVRTLPLVALLFLPILLGMQRLYPWAVDEVVAADPVLQHKRPFLNPTVFTLATLGYFAIWGLLARAGRAPADRRGSDGGYDEYPTRGQRRVAGFCLAVYVLSMSFAAFHWGMSLEPHWFSTIYGLTFCFGQVLSALALVTFVTARLSRRPPVAGRVSTEQFHDLGNLILALVMLWAYVALSQFLIIWSANLAEEAPWYIARAHPGWDTLAIVLVLFHFALPFAVLLSRHSKRVPAILAAVAAGLVAMRVLDLAWLVLPAFHPEELHVAWTDPVAFLALGGLWAWAFLRNLGQRPVVYRPRPVDLRTRPLAAGAEAEGTA